MALACGGCSTMSPSATAVSWVRCEAEIARTNGKVCGPSRQYGTPEVEASGRRYVRLEQPGDFVEFTVPAPANAMVLRFCIPDAPQGGGLESTLGLSINGEPQPRLKLTSRFAWHYGDYPWTNDPTAGNTHHYFDEVQAVFPKVGKGDVIRLQKDATDAAEYILIDLVEFELVPQPLPQPPDSLSLAEFDSLRECIAAAKERGKVVWIPEGTHFVDGPRIEVGGVHLQGAGMWHSRLTGPGAMFEGTGEPVEFSDLGIFGIIEHRDNESPDNAFNGNLGDGSVFSNLWIEHVKCGFWTTHGTKNMVLLNSRIRNVMADGLNFCDGTSFSTVENCHLRGTGDDALASWSPSGEWSSKQPCIGNRFVGNLIENPWLANGIAVYGGGGHVIAGNEIRETVISGAGIHISSGFEAVPFSQPIRVENNRIRGAGGECYIGEPVGGLWIYAKDSDIEVPVTVSGLVIEDSLHAGVSVHGPNAVKQLELRDVSIRNSSRYGVHFAPGSSGRVRMSNITVQDASARDIQNDGTVEVKRREQ